MTDDTAGTPPLRLDVDFLVGMIGRHATAVKMADIYLDNPVHDDLRAMCRDMKTSQSQQIHKMQYWLADWYGIPPRQGIDAGGIPAVERSASPSVAQFEIKFIESMIKHHRETIGEGETCVREAYYEELIELCEDIIVASTANIARMEEWLFEWHGLRRGRTDGL